MKHIKLIGALTLAAIGVGYGIVSATANTPNTIRATALTPAKPPVPINLKDAAFKGIAFAKLYKAAKASGLQEKALTEALNAYSLAYHKGKIGKNKTTLTVVDFTLPSNKKRMWVLDLKHGTVLMKILTTQGKHSGVLYAKHFSNRIGSDESSLGTYVTAHEYMGKHGRSIRLIGLEKGINSNAMRRSVVIHPAYYATPRFVKRVGRAGRSWGCFAVNPAIKPQLLRYIKDGSVLFAYDQQTDHNAKRLI